MDVPGQLDQEQATAASGIDLSGDNALPIGCKRDLAVPLNISNFVELPPVPVEPNESGRRDAVAVGPDEGVAADGKPRERAKELEA